MKPRSNKKVKKKSRIEHKKIKRVIKTREKRERKEKDSVSLGRIKQILNLSHPDDLYITLKLLDDKESAKLLTYFRKNRSKLHKKKELTKIIADSKTRVELLTNVKNYLINLLKKEYEEIKQQISLLRKKGKDMLIEDLKLMKIPSKIRLFEATEDKKDFYSVKQMIDKIKQEVEIKKN